MKNIEYAIPDSITAEEIKKVRALLNLTQKELSVLLGVSKPTVERWEMGKKEITGPVVLLTQILTEHPELVKNLIVPERELPLRMKYMHGNSLCTIIDVDEVRHIIRIKNYTDNIMFRAFGNNTEPSFEDYNDFLESRCFPDSRDKMKIILKDLELPFYDPLLIIEKTQGRMAEDDFWIQIER